MGTVKFTTGLILAGLAGTLCAAADGNGPYRYPSSSSLSDSGRFQDNPPEGRDYRTAQVAIPESERSDAVGAEVVRTSDRASPERLAAASGHYARARALLIEALAEFERGKEIARPDRLLDPQEWRASVVSRKGDLDRLLNPEPRISIAGTRFPESKRLLREVGQAQTAPKPPARKVIRTQEDVIVEREEKVPPPPHEEKAQPEGVSKSEEPAVAPPIVQKKVTEEKQVEKSAGEMIDGPAEDEFLRDMEAGLEQHRALPPAKESAEPAKKVGEREPLRIEEKIEEKVVEEKKAAAEGTSTAVKPEEEDPAVAKAIQDAVIQERLRRLTEEITANEQKKGE